MPKAYNVAVVGATGLVGQEFLKIALQRGFPLKGLRLLASNRSAGRRLTVGEWEIEVEETNSKSFSGVDLAFFSATTEVSKSMIPAAVRSGAIVIDDSSAWRMEPDVPLVVPEVNAADLEGHKGIISIPNCPTTPLVQVLWPIHCLNPVKRIIVDTYQSVSGHGGQAFQELTDQTRAVLDGNSATAHVFPHQIAFNLLPHVDVFLGSGYTKEEWKVMNETRKIMHEPELAVSATCVRVPVYIGHSEAVHAEFARPITPEEVHTILREAPGVTVQDEPSVNLYPMPCNVAGKDDTFVGRIRQDDSCPTGIAMWIVSDNLRKGAALNAIQIAEELIARSLI
ncbi:MAG TPA: aspartate-semialdehyde dehydrogenase [Dehalococcoidia bacterium]|nr:aspartate-semialdehyde dehydrogenase [Dehalococcoidia bacterium]